MTETITVLSSQKEGVDTRELRKLTMALKGFNPDKQLKKTLRKAGELVADEARVRAAAHSRQTPPTIKVRLSKTRISIVAGGPGVPIAGLLEMGNKGRGKSQAASSSGRFRHPVFGNKGTWVQQATHPYLLPAAAAKERAVEQMVAADVVAALKEAGI